MKNILDKIKNFEFKQLSILFMVLIIVFLNVSINIFNAKLSYIYAIEYFLFEIFLFFLPGVGISCILKWKDLSVIDLVATSSVFGFCANIIMYLLHMVFHIPLFFINLFVIIASILLIYKEKDYISSLKKEKTVSSIFFLCLVLILLVFQFFYFFQLNELPYIGNGNEYYSDFLYWIGDASELSIQFPPTHFRDPGQIYRYHYFSAIQLAYTNMNINMGIAKIVFVFSYINPIIMLISCAYLLFKRTSDYTFLQWLGVFILLFTTGQENNTSVNWIAKLYKCAFGLDISLAFLMLSLAFNIDYIKNKISNKKYILFQSVLLIMTLGIKSVTGMCLMLVLAFTCLYKLCKERDYKKYISLGIWFVVIFICLYAFVLSTFNASTSQNVSSSKLTLDWFHTSLFNNRVLAGYYQSLLNRNIPVWIAQFWMMIRYTLWCHFPIFSLFYLGIAYCLIKYKKITYEDVFTFIITILGIIALFLFNHDQYSQVYFVFSVYPIATFFAMMQLGKIYSQFRSKKQLLMVTSMCLVGYSLYGTYTITQQFFFKNYFPLAVEHFVNPQDTSVDPTVENHMMQPISKKEYEAYEWLRINTNKDDLLLSNFVFSNFQRNYSLGAFSERRVLLDSDLLQSVFYNGDDTQSRLKKKNIKYIVMNKWWGENEIPSNLAIEVYHNEEVRIYEVNK